MRAIVLLSLVLASATAIPASSQRIFGGSLTTIDNYPTIASLLGTFDGSNFMQICGSTIINTRSILTAAHCTTEGPARYRVRVGSTFANSGGVVHSASLVINHPNYNIPIFDNDISIVRTATNIAYVGNAVQPGSFAGANYNVGDNDFVWAAGWGITEYGTSSEQLRHVQLMTLNQGICQQRYSFISITDNMLCAHWSQGGRDQCSQDSGGPLYHNGVVIGVCSFGGVPCGNANVPAVNARVSRFITWIQANA